MKILCLFFSEKNPQIKSLAESCFQFTPKVALSSQAIFLEVSHIQKSADILWHNNLRPLCDIFDLSPTWAISNDIPTALSLAQFQVFSFKDLPILALPNYADPYEPQSIECYTNVLSQLGISKLQDLDNIHPKELSSRFHTPFQKALNGVKNPSKIPWQGLKLTSLIHETFDIDPPLSLENIESFYFFCKNLSDRVTARLHARKELISEMKLSLFQEKWSTVRHSEQTHCFSFSFPQANSTFLQKLLIERLSHSLKERSLAAPLEKISLLITKTLPAKDKQYHFFHDQKTDHSQQFITAINDRLGPLSCFLADNTSNYRPESSWKKTLSLKPKEGFARPPRPSRVFSPPIMIHISEDHKKLYWKNKRFEITDMKGPEIINGEWWDNYYCRSYYQINTQEGYSFWVFREEDSFFLHGIFD